jgi:hypothetical protein
MRRRSQSNSAVDIQQRNSKKIIKKSFHFYLIWKGPMTSSIMTLCEMTFSIMIYSVMGLRNDIQ